MTNYGSLLGGVVGGVVAIHLLGDAHKTVRKAVLKKKCKAKRKKNSKTIPRVRRANRIGSIVKKR